MNPNIQSMDDKIALRVLTTIAKHQFGAGETGIEPAADFRNAIAGATELDAVGASVSDGDMARQALLLHSDDPQLATIISSLADDSAQKQRFVFDPLTTAAVGTALICVLQTKIKFKRSEDGKYSFEFEKKALSDGVLKEFVQKFLSWLP